MHFELFFFFCSLNYIAILKFPLLTFIHFHFFFVYLAEAKEKMSKQVSFTVQSYPERKSMPIRAPAFIRRFFAREKLGNNGQNLSQPIIDPVYNMLPPMREHQPANPAQSPYLFGAYETLGERNFDFTCTVFNDNRPLGGTGRGPKIQICPEKIQKHPPKKDLKRPAELVLNEERFESIVTNLPELNEDDFFPDVDAYVEESDAETVTANDDARTITEKEDGDTVMADEDIVEEPVKKRGRGRPFGSKNVKKQATTNKKDALKNPSGNVITRNPGKIAWNTDTTIKDLFDEDGTPIDLKIAIDKRNGMEFETNLNGEKLFVGSDGCYYGIDGLGTIRHLTPNGSYVCFGSKITGTGTKGSNKIGVHNIGVQAEV